MKKMDKDMKNLLLNSILRIFSKVRSLEQRVSEIEKKAGFKVREKVNNHLDFKREIVLKILSQIKINIKLTPLSAQETKIAERLAEIILNKRKNELADIRNKIVAPTLESLNKTFIGSTIGNLIPNPVAAIATTVGEIGILSGILEDLGNRLFRILNYAAVLAKVTNVIEMVLIQMRISKRMKEILNNHFNVKLTLEKTIATYLVDFVLKNNMKNIVIGVNFLRNMFKNPISRFVSNLIARITAEATARTVLKWLPLVNVFINMAAYSNLESEINKAIAEELDNFYDEVISKV